MNIDIESERGYFKADCRLFSLLHLDKLKTFPYICNHIHCFYSVFFKLSFIALLWEKQADKMQCPIILLHLLLVYFLCPCFQFHPHFIPCVCKYICSFTHRLSSNMKWAHKFTFLLWLVPECLSQGRLTHSPVCLENFWKLVFIFIIISSWNIFISSCKHLWTAEDTVSTPSDKCCLVNINVHNVNVHSLA